MKLEGAWCTENIGNEHLQVKVFSTTEKNSFFKFCSERYVAMSCNLNIAYHENLFD